MGGEKSSEVTEMKTLYVSDLDGTLLSSKRQVSDNTVAILNKVMKQGAYFTVATARTPATVVPLLEGVEMELPVIVMNGSFIYDIKEKKYIYTSQVPFESVRSIIEIVEEEQKQIFVYTLKEDFLTVYYKGFNTPEEEAFYNERKDLKLKKFVQVQNYTLQPEHQVGHMVMIDSYEVIEKIVQRLKDVQGIKALMYRDVNTENSYILEIAAAKTNKAQGVKYVADLLGMDEVVAFGDNLNDMEMLEAADCGCAVANAEMKLKEIADCVIESNDQDGVARFIQQKVKKKSA